MGPRHLRVLWALVALPCLAGSAAACAPLAGAGGDSAYAGGAVANRFLQRDGLEAAERLAHGEAWSALTARWEELTEVCPGAAKAFRLHDAARDTRGGWHWVLRGPAAQDACGLLHVRNATGRRLAASPQELCGTEEQGRRLAAVTEPRADAPRPVHSSNKLVEESSRFAQKMLHQETVACQTGMVGEITVLAGSIGVVDGLVVNLHTEVKPADQDRSPTYHSLRVFWEVMDESSRADLVPRLELPYVHGVQLGWCELLTHITISELADLAKGEGADSVRRYHSMLGHAGSSQEDEADSNHAPPSGAIYTARCANSEHLPWHYDLRSAFSHCFTDAVLSQSGCGSGWAFAASSTASSRMCMNNTDAVFKDGRRLQFSVQQIMSCNEKMLGCGGGWMHAAFEEMKAGIILDSDYIYQPSTDGSPWQEDGQHCKWGSYLKPFRVTQYYSVAPDPQAMMAELYCNGPFSVAFEVYQNFFAFFRDGREDRKQAIYEGPGNSLHVGAHAAMLVGYGVQDGVQFWQLMNSWGKMWGDKGYFKMRRGVDQCRIESFGAAAAFVEETSGSWMKDGWMPCQDGSQMAMISCFDNRGAQRQYPDQCPTSPDVSGGFVSASRVPAQSCGEDGSTERLLECSSRQHCGGNGRAVKKGDGCVCECHHGFTGQACERCWNDRAGPLCRLKCTRERNCNGHGEASGVHWSGAPGEGRMDSCSCACDVGFKGARCDLPVPEPSPVPPDALSKLPGPPEGHSGWFVQAGDCLVDDKTGCATSPNYPRNYGPNQACTLLVSGDYVVRDDALEMHFDTEVGYDHLTVNGHTFSGDHAAGHDLLGLTPRTPITWTSDDTLQGSGWRLCIEKYTSTTTKTTTSTTSTTSTATTILPPNSGVVQWAAFKSKCLSVNTNAAGDYEYSRIQLWDCDKTSGDMKFAVPRFGTGVIRWSPSPTKCLSVRGGKAVDGSDITLSDCPADKEPAQMRFVLPENGTGLIRWAAHPGMCLDAGGGQSGDLFRLWTCDAGHPAMQFVLPVQPVCKTAGVEGVACALPFTYRGVKYERCTWKDHINPWCATQVDEKGSYVFGRWGTCASSCPTEEEPYVCSAGIIHWREGWSEAKRYWCCQHKGIGCRMSLFNCSEDADRWGDSWSLSKRTFCCEHAKLGCGFNCTASAGCEHWGREHSEWCYEHQGVSCSRGARTTTTPQPYDCAAGQRDWEKGWSVGKKLWCCRNSPPSGCSALAPFNCTAQVSESWSLTQGTWCCEHYGRGCQSSGREQEILKKFQSSPQEGGSLPQGLPWALPQALAFVCMAGLAVGLAAFHQRRPARQALLEVRDAADASGSYSYVPVANADLDGSPSA